MDCNGLTGRQKDRNVVDSTKMYICWVEA